MALTLLQTLGFMPRGGARGQNLGHFSFLFLFLWNHLYLNNRNYLRLNLSFYDFGPKGSIGPEVKI